jgi:hypothetical protein
MAEDAMDGNGWIAGIFAHFRVLFVQNPPFFLLIPILFGILLAIDQID